MIGRRAACRFEGQWGQGSLCQSAPALPVGCLLAREGLLVMKQPRSQNPRPGFLFQGLAGRKHSASPMRLGVCGPSPASVRFNLGHCGWARLESLVLFPRL